MLKIYNYNPETFEFVSEEFADESPLEKGVYLIPRCATKIPVIEVAENETPIFDVANKEWVATPDFRGTVWNDGENRFEINKLGVSPDYQWEEGEIPAPTSYEKVRFTSLEYLDKFTEAEQIGVVTAALTDVEVKLFYDRLLAATYIDITDPRTEQGIDLLISKSLIPASKKTTLLTPEVVNIEGE